MSLHVVFQKPSIIENVGNIIRTCLGFNATFHMIRPYGFIWSNANLKRSSTNHINQVKIFQYDDWESFYKENWSKNADFYFYTRYGNKAPNEFSYDLKNRDVYLVFGNEHYGIDKPILKDNLENCIRIPMSDELICLNVANSVAIACYEVVKQDNFNNLERTEIFNKSW